MRAFSSGTSFYLFITLSVHLCVYVYEEYVCLIISASVLALDEYSDLQIKYEQQLELNQAAEQFAHQVFITRTFSSLDNR